MSLWFYVKFRKRVPWVTTSGIAVKKTLPNVMACLSHTVAFFVFDSERHKHVTHVSDLCVCLENNQPTNQPTTTQQQRQQNSSFAKFSMKAAGHLKKQNSWFGVCLFKIWIPSSRWTKRFERANSLKYVHGSDYHVSRHRRMNTIQSVHRFTEEGLRQDVVHVCLGRGFSCL